MDEIEKLLGSIDKSLKELLRIKKKQIKEKESRGKRQMEDDEERDLWVTILGKKLRKYQAEEWWMLVQRLMKETYDEIKEKS